MNTPTIARRSLLTTTFLLLAFTTGCTRSDATPIDRNQIAATAITELLFASFTPTPTPIPKPDTPSDQCPDCRGTGYVGDGRIRQTCLTCNGRGKLTDAARSTNQPPTVGPAVPAKLHDDATRRTKATATPTWTAFTIQSCNGSFCTRVSGQLHSSGQWFYSHTGHYYRRHGNLWKPHAPHSTKRIRN